MKRSVSGQPFSKTKWNIFAIDEWKVVWILPPKTASTAVRKALAASLNLQATDFHDIKRFSGLTPADALKLKERGYLCVGAVRHPLPRLISCWYEKAVCDPYYIEFTVYDEFWPKMPFEDFVAAVAQIPDEDAEPHFRSLSFSLAVGDELLPDVLLEQSRLDQDWAALQAQLAGRLGPGTSLPDLTPINVTNSTTRIPPPSEAVVDLIAERYAEDFARFGYERQPPA